MSYYVTFGQRYAREEHPRFADVHPDAVIELNVATYDEARAFAIDLFGQAWSDLYDQEDWENFAHFYPRGVVVTLTPGEQER